MATSLFSAVDILVLQHELLGQWAWEPGVFFDNCVRCQVLMDGLRDQAARVA